MSRLRGQNSITTGWDASPSQGQLFAVVGIVLSFLIVVSAGYALWSDEVGPFPVFALIALVILPLLAMIIFGVLLQGYRTIRYTLSDEAITVTWLFRTRTIPLQNVTYIGPLSSRDEFTSTGPHWFWPGYYVNRVRTPNGWLTTVATLPQERQLLVETVRESVAISPTRPVHFLEEFRQRWEQARIQTGQQVPQRLTGRSGAVDQLADAGWTGVLPSVGNPVGSDQTQRAGRRALGYQTLESFETSSIRLRDGSVRPLFSDRLALALLTASVAGCVAMILVILAQYDQLPASIILHWTVDGLPGRVGDTREIWIFPAITAIITIANAGLAWSIARFDRVASRLLLGGSIMTHLVVWIALVEILR